MEKLLPLGRGRQARGRNGPSPSTSGSSRRGRSCCSTDPSPPDFARRATPRLSRADPSPVYELRQHDARGRRRWVSRRASMPSKSPDNPVDPQASHRLFSAPCFDKAWELIERPRRTPAEDRRDRHTAGNRPAGRMVQNAGAGRSRSSGNSGRQSLWRREGGSAALMTDRSDDHRGHGAEVIAGEGRKCRRSPL